MCRGQIGCGHRAIDVTRVRSEELFDAVSTPIVPRLQFDGETGRRALVVLVGIFDVISVLGNRALARVASWDTALPFTVAHGTRTFVVLAGIFLIMLGRGLLHGRRTAWYASLFLLSASLVSSFCEGSIWTRWQ